jgi:hypothetical protein
MTFIFKIIDFAHFLTIHSQSGQNFEKYLIFDIPHPLSLLHSENDVSGIFTENALYQTDKKTLFFGAIDQIDDF